MENQTREEAAAILRQGGMRITRQRQLVMAALLQAGGPLTAQAVAEQSGDPTGCNRSTVYRTLAALEGRGLVYRRLGADGSTLYALRREHHGHILYCLVCGRRFSLIQCPLEGLEREIYETTGFLVQGHSLEFTGVCAECREKIKK